MQRNRNADQIIDQIENILKEKISDPQLNVNHLAFLLGLSVQRVYQLMYFCYQNNPKKIIESCRLAYALRLINNTPEMNLHKVAVLSGFSNYNTFFRCFRRKVRSSPSDFVMLPGQERLKIQSKYRVACYKTIRSRNLETIKISDILNN